MIEQRATSDLRSDITFALGVVAAGGAAMALVALVLPQAARPMVSLIIALGLATVAFVVVRQLARGAGNLESPFDHRVPSTSGDWPTELQGLLRDVQAIRSNDSIPMLLADRLRRCALRRLRERHGVELRTEHDWRRLGAMVSPDLYLVLTGDVAGVTGGSVAELVDEVERL